MSVFFNGQLLVTPTTASVVNDDAMQNQNLTVGNAVVFVGKSTGGEPLVDLSFGNPEEAKQVLRGGELLDAVLAAFDPSAETGAPSTVHAVRVNPATQASLTLKSAAAADVIALSSSNYGLEDNQIKIKVEAGTLSGKRLTVQYGTQLYTGDNIARDVFKITYTGAEATAVMAIAADKVTLTAGATTPVEISLTQFKTIDALVDKINSLGGYTASVEGKNGTKTTLNGLDFVTSQNVKVQYTATANLQAIVDWFNNSGQPLVTATRSANAGAVPANIPFTFLSGGADGNTTNQEWSDAFAVLQTVDVQWVSPISGDAAIHAMADSHVAFCSTVLRTERRAICGTEPATSDDAAIAAVKLINSDRTSLVHLGYYAYNSSGELELRAPYMTAALIAAAFAGVNPGTPLTNKTLKVRGWERKLRKPTDTDKLILGGVLCVEEDGSGYKVVKSITTWLGNDNYNRVEQSTGAALDFTVRNVRQAVDVLRGQKANPLLLSRAISITDSTLRELARAEPQGPGVLAGDANSPAYRNISASIEGDVVRVQFECSPVIPANYILVTVYAVPYSGSVTA